MFERLQANQLERILLTIQYRMHPGVADFPSRWFYKGAIMSGAIAAITLPGTLCCTQCLERSDVHPLKDKTRMFRSQLAAACSHALLATSWWLHPDRTSQGLTRWPDVLPC
jgi:hypothetical protein